MSASGGNRKGGKRRRLAFALVAGFAVVAVPFSMYSASLLPDAVAETALQEAPPATTTADAPSANVDGSESAGLATVSDNPPLAYGSPTAPGPGPSSGIEDEAGATGVTSGGGGSSGSGTDFGGQAYPFGGGTSTISGAYAGGGGGSADLSQPLPLTGFGPPVERVSP